MQCKLIVVSSQVLQQTSSPILNGHVVDEDYQANGGSITKQGTMWAVTASWGGK
jgi:hypothetical protein